MKTKKTSSVPRTKPAEVRLDELMDAAQHLFITKGIESTTVSEIVRDAQVAKGTFYHYFPSKNEMLSALRERFTQIFIERIQQSVDNCPSNDSIARLRAWCDAGIAAYFDGMDVHDALYHDHHYPTRSNKDRDAVVEQILTILNDGSACGAWKLANPRLTAIIMYHGMHGAVDDAMASDQDEKNKLSHQLTEEFLRLISPVHP
ncbi:TetR/AcrR family transcriptional regulator [Rahnella perminowiae]|uniref:TetR/AcrR family transcriptional regulator n=1 Tax=Rahnella perminowiae TaxID=2816244 RepID=UPI001EE61115|nr:TetR/AcrR family transcriptional regulator [Rahnella perminowiae]